MILTIDADKNVTAIFLMDTFPPIAVVDLVAKSGSQEGSVELSWTAPGDDGQSGTAASYLVRYNTLSIETQAKWDAATPVIDGVPQPKVAGSNENMTVYGLDPGTEYHFAVRAQDEIPNLSGLSNSSSAIAYNPPDTNPPASITLTSVTGTVEGAVDLSWIAPADDGFDANSGLATSYSVRYRVDHSIVTEADWNEAIPVTSGVPTPVEVGTEQSMIVRELTPGVTYYFAVRAQDEVPNLSGWTGDEAVAANLSPTSLPIVDVQTEISTDTNWTSGSVYLITGQTTVKSGVTLAIEPGSIIKFKTSSSNVRGKLIVNGQLLAQGNDGNPIVFTSFHDDVFGGDSNNNGGSSWPDNGDWDGLEFSATNDNSVLDHSLVHYGGNDNTNVSIAVISSSISITNSSVRYSGQDGIEFKNSATGQLNGNEISYNLNNAVSLNGSSNPTISNNTIINNQNYAVYLEGNSFPIFENNIVYGNAINGIGVYGNVGSGTWYPDFPYIATENLIIESGNILNIQPGCVVKLSNSRDFIVRGSLVADATDVDRIVFTSLKDDDHGGDTMQDGGSTRPNPGDWGALYFADTSDDSTSVLNYVTVWYGGSGYSYGAGTAYANLVLDSASPSVSNSRFEHSDRYGVQLVNASSPDFQANVVSDNIDHGLWLSPSSSPQVAGNDLLRNGGYAVYVTGSSQPVFENNTANGNEVNGIGITGTINGNTTWEFDLPYVIDSSLTLNLNTTLTIQPGVVTKLNDGALFTIHGRLLAQGEAEDRIVFSSLKDDNLYGDTNGDGTTSAPCSR